MTAFDMEWSPLNFGNHLDPESRSRLQIRPLDPHRIYLGGDLCPVSPTNYYFPVFSSNMSQIVEKCQMRTTSKF